MTAQAPVTAPKLRTCAVLTAACDGYPAGTTGEVLGSREGCVVLAPDSHATIARWATPRKHLLVPQSLLVVLD